jgi:hypothetical protein
MDTLQRCMSLGSSLSTRPNLSKYQPARPVIKVSQLAAPLGGVWGAVHPIFASGRWMSRSVDGVGSGGRSADSVRNDES